MDESKMQQVAVFCYRTDNGYFGFGLTPESALEACYAVGLPRRYDHTRGLMKRLPDGVTHYAVGADGGLYWKGGAEGAQPTRYFWDKRTKRFTT